MAKIMIEVDVPEFSYDELWEAMNNHQSIEGVDFKKGGIVVIGSYILERSRQKDIPAYDPSVYEFKVIGVRP